MAAPISATNRVPTTTGPSPIWVQAFNPDTKRGALAQSLT
jgi:hypothetical protein